VLVVPFSTNLYFAVYVTTEGLLVILSALWSWSYIQSVSRHDRYCDAVAPYIKFALATAILVAVLLLLMEKTPDNASAIFTFECAMFQACWLLSFSSLYS